MAAENDTLTAGRAAGQAIAAVAVVAALGLGLWAQNEFASSSSSSNGAPRPASCSDGAPEEEKETKRPKVPGYVPGTRLCQALNRSDLPELLGTPGEIAQTASGGDGSFGRGKRAVPLPAAEVQFDTYTVKLAASYDRLPVKGSAALLGSDAWEEKFLGRPAVRYSTRTLSIRFRLDGSDAESGGPGLPVRTLSVARDAKDSGGSYELSIFRTDGGIPEDAVLLRVAERVLPRVPGWEG